jgi:hypothetical protein
VVSRDHRVLVGKPEGKGPLARGTVMIIMMYCKKFLEELFS